MADPDEAALASCPERLHGPLARCASGELPPHVALMQLFVAAAEPREAATALDRAIVACEGGADPSGARRLREAQGIWRANPQAWTVVKATLAGIEHGGSAATPEDGIATWAAVFDRAAKVSPEASVALYSLGSPELLESSTAEVVGRMREWDLLGPERRILDLGCGIGRFARALAPEAGEVVGIDISAAMLELAAKRCAGLGNVRLQACSGRDLAPFADSSFDLVLAADSFPYLVQSGMALVDRHMREAARVLRPGGNLLIVNFSYRGDLEADRRDILRLARAAGLHVIRNGTREFKLWDGAVFRLVKPGGAERPRSRRSEARTSR